MISAAKSSVDEQIDVLLSRVEEHMDTRAKELVAHLSGDISQNVKMAVERAEYNGSKRMKYSIPTDDNEIYRKYTTGDYSIMRCLPVPDPVVTSFGGVIPAKLLFNHIVALDIPLKIYDSDEDWTDDSGQYDGTFYRNWHMKIKEMKRHGLIPDETRIVFIRIWSDGFQAFPIRGDNEYNSMQLYTLTVLSSRGEQTKQHTLPFALCFKKYVNSDIFNSLVEQCNELLQVREVYFGRENKVFHTVAILETVGNDMPERFDNCSLCYKGKFTTRFRYSCDVSDLSKFICLQCESRVIYKHLSGTNKPIKECALCTMWGSECRIKAIDNNVLNVANTPHIAKLSFE